ncbi:AsnC family transcriptional regulator [Nocardia brasiliensis]|uniref:AsnC family transcriptional regulator n=1 Tax=Nocardia brasiliensis TaxID=37326 RepID=UPI0024562931|nr:AsnC family transcriptional regulator [Nocardia brasiliensis]
MTAVLNSGRVDVPAFDELDRQLIHALHCDGRAAFSAIGEVLAVSDKTVARRYARLRAAGALRVFAHVRMHSSGSKAWSLRIRCGSAATAVAEELAHRPDTSWVAITSGAGEVLCTSQNNDDGDNTALFTATLPRTTVVESVAAQRILYGFAMEGTGFAAKHGPLTDAQTRRLSAGVPAAAAPPLTPATPMSLSSTDHKMLTVLAQDGRRDYERLAEDIDCSPSTVRRRIAELRSAQILQFGVEADWSAFGLKSRAALWLSVQPAYLDAAGRALAEHPEVTGVAAVTGPANLFAGIIVPDETSMYGYLAGKLAAIPGIVHVETVPVVRLVKRAARAL